MFLPLLQSPSNQTYLVVRSDRDPAQVMSAIRSTVQPLDTGLPLYISPCSKEMDSVLFPSRMAAMSLGVLGTMVARQAAAKVWRMLTGEQPPVGRPAPAPDAGRQPPPATPAVREEAVPAGSAAASP